jgi:hypothetical protein
MLANHIVPHSIHDFQLPRPGQTRGNNHIDQMNQPKRGFFCHHLDGEVQTTGQQGVSALTWPPTRHTMTSKHWISLLLHDCHLFAPMNLWLSGPCNTKRPNSKLRVALLGNPLEPATHFSFLGPASTAKLLGKI